MATKKAGGSSKNGRDSRSQRLGVKVYGNMYIAKGAIIVRQRGTKYLPGHCVALGKDHTLFALENGFVKYTWFVKLKKMVVSVIPYHSHRALKKHALRVIRKK